MKTSSNRFVVVLHNVGDRCQNSPDGEVIALHMTEVARILHHDATDLSTGSQALGVLGDELVNIDDALAELRRRLGTE